jgi:hypothetical protein
MFHHAVVACGSPAAAQPVHLCAQAATAKPTATAAAVTPQVGAAGSMFAGLLIGGALCGWIPAVLSCLLPSCASWLRMSGATKHVRIRGCATAGPGLEPLVATGAQPQQAAARAVATSQRCRST